MKKFLLSLILVLILSIPLCLSGCFNLGSSSNNSNTSSSSNNHTSSSATFGERNALSSAKNYLRYMGFSKEGLKDQLEFEGYSTSEATYAVNNCGANWYEQAVKVAKNYLSVMSFSKQSLKEQLLFEGFTEAEANYGVENAYK